MNTSSFPHPIVRAERITSCPHQDACWRGSTVRVGAAAREGCEGLRQAPLQMSSKGGNRGQASAASSARASDLMAHGVERQAAAVIAASINRQKVALDPGHRDMVLKVLDKLVGLRAQRAQRAAGGGAAAAATASDGDGAGGGSGGGAAVAGSVDGIGEGESGKGLSSRGKVKAALQEEKEARHRERKLKRMIKEDKKQAKQAAEVKARTVARVANPALAGKNVRLTLRTVGNAGDCKVVVLARGKDLSQVFSTAKKKFVSKKNKVRGERKDEGKGNEGRERQGSVDRVVCVCCAVCVCVAYWECVSTCVREVVCWVRELCWEYGGV